MALNETIHLHRKHRVCIGKNGTQKIWNRYSFWTHASDVFFEDGTSLAVKISSIMGITKDINSGEGYAADVTLVKSIRDNLKNLIDNLSNLVTDINRRLGGLTFYEDSNGKWVVGADSVPKKLGSGGIGSATNIHEIHEIRSRNHEPRDGTGDEYNWISQFDLKDALGPDYASKRILEDFYVFPKTIHIHQGHSGDPAEFYKEMNISSKSWNNLNSSEFPGMDWWASTFPVDGVSGDDHAITSFEMDYVYDTGQLYVIWFSNDSIRDIRVLM